MLNVFVCVESSEMSVRHDVGKMNNNNSILESKAIALSLFRSFSFAGQRVNLFR